MFGGLRNNLRKHRGKWGIAFSAVFLPAGLFVYEPATPDGVYYDPNMACEHGVWIFKNGTILEECAGETPLRKCDPYFKSKTEWVGVGKPGERPIFKPSLFGITWIDPSLQSGRNFYLRDSLSWVIDFKEWIREHL